MKTILRRGSVGIVILSVVAATVYAFLPQPVSVDTAVVTRGALRVTVNEDGKTRIKERYLVSSPLAGRLMRIELDAGDAVDAGKTVLTRIEPTDPELLDPRAQAEAEARVKAAEAKLAQAGPNLEKALAAMQFAESEAARARELHRQNAISKDQVEETALQERTTTQQYKSARFDEEIATFELQLAKAALLRTRADSDTTENDWFFEISAPITGRVLRIIQKSSMVVASGTPLLELGDPHDLEVVIDVLSSDAVKIQPRSKVFLEQWGGEDALMGRVRLVEPSGFTKISALGVEEQRVNVIVDFDDPPEKRSALGDGFRVEARIVVWEHTDVIKVPTSALFRRQDDWAVFVMVDGKARLRPVTIGHRSGFEAQVTSGIEDREIVIVHPNDQVADGTEVIPK